MSLLRALTGRTKLEARTISSGDIGWTTISGGSDDPSSFALSAVFACETLIADSIATLPKDTFRRGADGVKVETVPPVWVNRPNPIHLPVDFDTQRVMSLLGYGDSFSLLVRANGMHSDPTAPVVERWPLAPWAVNVQGSVEAPIYRVNGTVVPTAAIQHIPGYRLPGALRGMSVVEYASRSLNLYRNAERFGEKFFENGAMPSGVLQVPQMPAEVSAAVVDRLRDQFAGRHSGSDNAGRPMALVGGTTWEQITVDPAAAQFLETRKFQIEDVCRWFRVPPHEVQHITDHASQGGGQGIEQMSIRFAQRTLLPWTIRLEQSDSLLLPRGQFIRYNVDASIRSDLKSRYEAHKIAIDAGMATPNQRLDLEDAEHVPAGDAVRVPLNVGLYDDNGPLQENDDEPVPQS